MAPASALPRQLDFKNGQKWRQNAGSSCRTAVAWSTSAASAAEDDDLSKMPALIGDATNPAVSAFAEKQLDHFSRTSYSY